MVGHFGIPFSLMVKHMVFLFGLWTVTGCYKGITMVSTLVRQKYSYYSASTTQNFKKVSTKILEYNSVWSPPSSIHVDTIHKFVPINVQTFQIVDNATVFCSGQDGCCSNAASSNTSL